MKVAITGAAGLIGWHLRCALHASGAEVVAVPRAALASADALTAALRGVDAVVHAAGANRGPEAEVAATNVALATTLAAAVTALGVAPYVVYLNSTHVTRDSAYGRSKRDAARLLAATGAPFLDLVLPGVFGEHGKPFYNSVVSTFCHQLAQGEALSVRDDGEMHLLHVQDVADVVLGALAERLTGQEHPAGRAITVHALAARLTTLSDLYAGGVVPSIGDAFDRALFNTLRSYRFPALYPSALTPRTDDRGTLVELVKANTGGQLFISTTKPGVTRGNHYHRRKVERFVVVGGVARISLRRLFHTEVISFDVSGESPVSIDMPTMHTHNITNTGDDTLTTVFWSDEIFDPARPDTYAEVV